jgi:hypothetical protein
MHGARGRSAEREESCFTGFFHTPTLEPRIEGGRGGAPCPLPVARRASGLARKHGKIRVFAPRALHRDRRAFCNRVCKNLATSKTLYGVWGFPVGLRCRLRSDAWCSGGAQSVCALLRDTSHPLRTFEPTRYHQARVVCRHNTRARARTLVYASVDALTQSRYSPNKCIGKV